MSEIRHAILVYRIKSTGEIICAYADRLPPTTNDPDLEHIATLNPRLWIERNWNKVETKP
jgi:hypothetical protein